MSGLSLAMLAFSLVACDGSSQRDTAIDLGISATRIEIPIREPSAIAYHAERKSLFVVGDEGDLGELGLDFKRVKETKSSGDYEGVAINPITQTVVVASESTDSLLEFDAGAQKLLSERVVDWSSHDDFKKRKAGNKGLEGVCFVRTGSDDVRLFCIKEAKPARLIELRCEPPKGPTGDVAGGSDRKSLPAQIVRTWDLGLKRLSDVTYSDELKCFLIPSAGDQIALVVDIEGRERLRFKLPGDKPEGLVFLPSGDLVVVQDSGGGHVLKGARQAIQSLLDQSSESAASERPQ